VKANQQRHLALQARRKRQPAFLKLYRASGQLVKSLSAAGIDDRQHYRWLERDDWYLAQFTKAA
jgi:hypothetical protein